MAKRAATTELNHDNWNDEEPAEEAGTFRVASSEVTSKRVFKKAKRRLAEDSGTNPAFKEFSGFGSLKSSGSSSPFSALLNSSNAFKSSFDASVPKIAISPFVVGEPGKTLDPKPALGDTQNSKTEYLQQLRSLNESVVSWIRKQVDREPQGVMYPIFNEYNEYLRKLAQSHSQNVSTPSAEFALHCELFSKKDMVKLRRLNIAVLDWITLHVGKNAFCVLTPVFVDYADYIKGFEEKGPKPKPVSSPSVKYVFQSSPIAPFQFSLAQSPPPNGGATESSPITPFRFNNANSALPSGGASVANDDDNYEPPKNEVREVKEDDAFHSVRCKLFYKKEGKYVEKGVGNLFLKSIDGRTQLLVRAETNLGNILLNVFVVPKTPTSRVGKNNVTLVCIPNPPLDPKSSATSEPVTFLVRVKDEAEADELHKKLEENKK